MKIKNTNNLKTPLIIVAVVIALIAIGIFTYLYGFKGSLFGWAPFATSEAAVNYNPPSKDQIEAGNQAKTNTVNGSDNDSDNPKTPTGTQSGTDTPSATPANSVSINITAANQNDATLQVRALISTTTTQGTCTLKLSKSGSNTVTKTADVQALADSSTCKGFNVPTTELSPGTWTLSLTYNNGGQSVNASQTVIIR